MKALVATDYGSPPSNLEVTEVPDPVPGPGELLVRIEAAALNPIDLKLITGVLKDVMPVTFPHLIGMDGSGTVAGLGEGVAGYAEGDPIVGFFHNHPGTVAEYALIEEGPALVARPEALDAVHAAAIPESGLTALMLLGAAELQPGEVVLVIGATGGVGLFLVQLAAAAGAQVIATARGEEDVDYVRGLGAAEVVDYKDADAVEQTLELHPDGVDVVFDMVNLGDAVTASARAAREGGRLVSPLRGPEDLGRNVAAVYPGSMSPRPGELERLVAQVAEGKLKVEVSHTYTLDESPRAMADFAEKHKRGKFVITA
jgi:NADPH:quinone reductase-like Zn-dependent oxidoreductase